MRKLFTLILGLSLAAATCQAQEAVEASANLNASFQDMGQRQPGLLATFDTLITPAAYGCRLTLYTFSGYPGSFVYGTNLRDHREKLVKYSYSANEGKLRNLLVSFARKKEANPDSTMTGVYYSCSPLGAPSLNTRVLGDRIPMSFIDTSIRQLVFTDFSFSSAVQVADSFFVGFVNPTTQGDSVGAWSSSIATTAACTLHQNRNIAYQRLAAGTFQPLRTGFGATFVSEPLFFVILEQDSVTGLNKELADMVGVRPVPATNQVVVSLPYNLKGQVSYALYSAQGQVVQQGRANASSALFAMDRNALPKGVYTLRVSTILGPVVKRVVFE